MKIKLYDINDYVKRETDNYWKAFYDDEELVIIKTSKGIAVTSFNGVLYKHKSVNAHFHIDTMFNDDTKNALMPESWLVKPLREIMKNAKYKEVDSKKYFHKRNSTESQKQRFKELLDYLKSIELDVSDF